MDSRKLTQFHSRYCCWAHKLESGEKRRRKREYTCRDPKEPRYAFVVKERNSSQYLYMYIGTVAILPRLMYTKEAERRRAWFRETSAKGEFFLASRVRVCVFSFILRLPAASMSLMPWNIPDGLIYVLYVAGSRSTFAGSKIRFKFK